MSAIEHWYARLIARMVRRSALMAVVALALIAATGYGFSRVPTGFLPIEDQGYMIALVQLPDGASLERTQKTLDKVFEISPQDAGRRAGRSPSPACRRSTTARRCRAPASPTSC